MDQKEVQFRKWLSTHTEFLGEIRPAQTALRELSDADILLALQQTVWPSGAPGSTLAEAVEPGEKVCFVVSDHTRKTATDRLMPVILRVLTERGCSVSDFSVLVAGGIHRPSTAAEIEQILGSAAFNALRPRIHTHQADADDQLCAIGVTRRNHTVRINRRAVECDRLILVGAATYHYHAGFGGGRKSLVPGVACRQTIAHNHSLTIDPRGDRIRDAVAPGILDGNPVAEEMLESARLAAPDMIVNSVLDPAGRLVAVRAGELDAAHRAACEVVTRVCRADIPERADLVIASAAGAGTWIQSHKALYNASRAVNDTGRIVLTAPCPEGLGNERFRYWLSVKSIPDLYQALRRSCEVNGQTALSTRLRGRQTILVTELPPQDRELLGIPTAPDLQAACRQAIEECARAKKRPTCYLLPDARSVLPFAKEIPIFRS